MDDITRRRFLDRARTYALGGLAGAAALEALAPERAWAQQASDGSVTPQDWLTLTDEAALEPELPIIDPHHHLWDRPGNRNLLEDLVAGYASAQCALDGLRRVLVDVPRRRTGRAQGGRRDGVRAGHRGDERERPIR